MIEAVRVPPLDEFLDSIPLRLVLRMERGQHIAMDSHSSEIFRATGSLKHRPREVFPDE